MIVRTVPGTDASGNAQAASETFGFLTISAGYRGQSVQGEAGNSLFVTLSQETTTDRYSVTIQYGSDTGTVLESWSNLREADLVNKLNDPTSGSKYIYVKLDGTISIGSKLLKNGSGGYFANTAADQLVTKCIEALSLFEPALSR